jgi:hypothetical protein
MQHLELTRAQARDQRMATFEVDEISNSIASTFI